jgi:hypothetical protein
VSSAASRDHKPGLLDPIKLSKCLEELASEQVDTRDHELSLQEAPPSSSLSALSAREQSAYLELIRDGARPACTTTELARLIDNPSANREAIRPWLHDYTNPDDEDGEIKTVFTRQFEHWWDFRKSQWNNRGDDANEAGFPAYLAASRRRYEGSGDRDMVNDRSFEETINQRWRSKSAPGELFGDQGFHAHSETVRRQMCRYKFRCCVQLKQDPSQQDSWNNWLEYLNFVQCRSEQVTIAAARLTDQFCRARHKLCEVLAPQVTDTRCTHSLVPKEDRPASDSSVALKDYLRETEEFACTQRAVLAQKRRLDWVIDQARQMDIEKPNGKRKADSIPKEEASHEPPWKKQKGESGVQRQLRRSRRELRGTRTK